jgi:hypothetical protein
MSGDTRRLFRAVVHWKGRVSHFGPYMTSVAAWRTARLELAYYRKYHDDSATAHVESADVVWMEEA